MFNYKFFWQWEIYHHLIHRWLRLPRPWYSFSLIFLKGIAWYTLRGRLRVSIKSCAPQSVGVSYPHWTYWILNTQFLHFHCQRTIRLFHLPVHLRSRSFSRNWGGISALNSEIGKAVVPAAASSSLCWRSRALAWLSPHPSCIVASSAPGKSRFFSLRHLVNYFDNTIRRDA